jgi:ATP-dependent Lon protease
MPKSNEKDLRDVPEEVKKQISFTFVGTMDEVLRLALLPSTLDGADADDVEEGEAEALTSESVASVPVTSETGTLVNADRA